MKLNPEISRTPARSDSPKTAASSASVSGEFNEWLELEAIRRLAKGNWHEYCIDAPFQVEKILVELAPSVHRSRCYDVRKDDPEALPWIKLLLTLEKDCLALVAPTRLEVYARSPGQARDVAEGLWQVYHRMTKPRVPTFHLIKETSCGMAVEDIPMQQNVELSPETLALHYGEEILPWHEMLAEEFRSRPTGITLMEGPPGTGKTSYIRHLMGELKESHRFYFVPSSNLGVLKDTEFVDFWSQQRRWYPGQQMVVILEDAEEALFARCSNNRAEVSVLLNITDGLLGEFLRLQVVCTVNCPAHHLEPALLRPGRLVARRHFGRLPREKALVLARSLGKDLHNDSEEDYSLAEIFSGEKDSPNRPNLRIGFQPEPTF